jgi:predicted CXXCH cytochrome family protein
MKSSKLLTSLAVTAAFLTITGSAFGALSGSAHDFSDSAGLDGDAWNTGGEMCAPCHTTHNGIANSANAPLWNRTTATNNYTLYTSTTMNADLSGVTTVGAMTLLCLSCHDGTIALDAFGGAAGDITHQMDALGSSAALSNDLSNDHPVGFLYADSVSGGDTELKAEPTNLTNAGYVTCASCHDVHNTPGIDGMLVMSNAQSALCTQCHDK